MVFVMHCYVIKSAENKVLFSSYKNISSLRENGLREYVLTSEAVFLVFVTFFFFRVIKLNPQVFLAGTLALPELDPLPVWTKNGKTVQLDNNNNSGLVIG